MQEKKLRAAIVDAQGKVLNVVAYCPVRSKSWQPPVGTTLVFHTMADVGDYWDHGKKELHKPCGQSGCTDRSHKSGRVHPYAIHPEQKEE